MTRSSTAFLLKRDSNAGFLLWILWIIQEHLFAEDLWTAGSETPVRLFESTCFYWTSSVAASDSFSHCNFIKKGTREKMFICNFCKIFKKIFWQNISGCLLLVFFCEFWEVFQITTFIEHLWETAYFIYKLPNFNNHIQ